MQPARAALPELEAAGAQAVAAPVRRARDVAVGVAIPERLLLPLQVVARGDRLALRRDGRSDAGIGRAAVEIVVGFGLRRSRHLSLDPHLPLQFGPEEQQAGPWVLIQFPPLAAKVVREEHEAV